MLSITEISSEIGGPMHGLGGWGKRRDRRRRELERMAEEDDMSFPGDGGEAHDASSDRRRRTGQSWSPHSPQPPPRKRSRESIEDLLKRECARRSGPRITHDDVLDFHLMLKDIYGIDKRERDFFARFDRSVFAELFGKDTR